MKNDLGYLSAKLEEMHYDIKILQAHVDELRQEASGRKAIHRVLIGGLSALTTVLGWVVYHIT